jgi:hypothetical protein
MTTIQRIVGAGLCLAFIPMAFAAGKQTEAQRQYQQERAHCTSGKSHQDRATCLKEAENAYSEARKGALGSSGDSELAKNATKRCEAQPAADRAACEQRILGAGTTEGSVKGGGLIRETETKVP